MTCPLCQGSLASAPVGLDRCASCGATWFDHGELAATVHHPGSIEAALRGAAHGRTHCRWCGGDAAAQDVHCGRPVRVRCPRCSAVLSTVAAGEVHLDVCFGCGGLFVDGPAMERLAALVVPEPTEAPARDLGFDPSAMRQLVTRALSDFIAGRLS